MAFHPYPQVIRPVFNLSRFGPPRDVTRASPCPWVDHSVSGLPHATWRPLRTRFRSGSASSGSTSPRRTSRWRIMQKARSHPVRRNEHGAPTACRHRVSGSLSLPSLGCFSPFPHGTGPLSVDREYLALEDGPPRFRQGSSCPGVLGVQAQEVQRASCTGLSPSLAGPSRTVPLRVELLTSRGVRRLLQLGPTTPCMQRRRP